MSYTRIHLHRVRVGARTHDAVQSGKSILKLHNLYCSPGLHEGVYLQALTSTMSHQHQQKNKPRGVLVLTADGPGSTAKELMSSDGHRGLYGLCPRSSVRPRAPQGPLHLQAVHPLSSPYEVRRHRAMTWRTACEPYIRVKVSATAHNMRDHLDPDHNIVGTERVTQILQ